MGADTMHERQQKERDGCEVAQLRPSDLMYRIAQMHGEVKQGKQRRKNIQNQIAVKHLHRIDW